MVNLIIKHANVIATRITSVHYVKTWTVRSRNQAHVQVFLPSIARSSRLKIIARFCVVNVRATRQQLPRQPLNQVLLAKSRHKQSLQTKSPLKPELPKQLSLEQPKLEQVAQQASLLLFQHVRFWVANMETIIL